MVNIKINTFLVGFTLGIGIVTNLFFFKVQTISPFYLGILDVLTLWSVLFNLWVDKDV